MLEWFLREGWSEGADTRLRGQIIPLSPRGVQPLPVRGLRRLPGRARRGLHHEEAARGAGARPDRARHQGRAGPGADQAGLHLHRPRVLRLHRREAGRTNVHAVRGQADRRGDRAVRGLGLLSHHRRDHREQDLCVQHRGLPGLPLLHRGGGGGRHEGGHGLHRPQRGQRGREAPAAAPGVQRGSCRDQ